MIRSPVTHPHLRALAALVAVALAALFLPFAAGPAAAADVQGFEIDGDLIDAPAGGAADWNTRLTAPTLNDQDPSDSTVFSASSKEYNDPSTWTFAGQPPQKDDIGNVYVDTDLVGGDIVLRLAWDRNGTTGTDTYYLELNKSPNVSPAIPSRTVGDLRLGIEEQGNGVLAVLDASQWTTTGGGSWQSIPLGMSGFAYAVNAAPVALPAGWTSPWAVGSYEAEQFIETSFDLTALIGLQPGCPPAFGTLNFRNATGGGGGLASNLKDAIGGVEVPAPDTCGTVIVHKDTLPAGSAQAFELDSTLGSAASTNGGLEGKSISDTSTGSVTALDVQPGAYTLTELVSVGWDFTGVVCVDPDGGTTATGPLVALDVDEYETVTCTYTNTQRGAIVVEKVAYGGGDDTFAFTGDVTASLQDGETAAAEGLLPGGYSVAEELTPEQVAAGWYLDDIVCDDEDSTGSVPDSEAAFLVDPGESVTCTFVNVMESDLTIVKSNDPTGLVPLGGTVTYTLKVGVPAGGGYNQEQVVVTDYIPGYDPAVTGSGTMTYVEGSATCDTGLFPCAVAYDATAKKLTWTIDEIAVGEFRTLTYKATVDKTQASIPSGQSGTVTLKNVAAVDSLYTDLVKSNEVQNTASIEVAVLPQVIVPAAVAQTGVAAPLGPIALAGMLLIGTGAVLAFGARRRSEGELGMSS